MSDFSETFGQLSDRERSGRSTPKKTVTAQFPRAYGVRYRSGVWVIYKEPAKPEPRGRVAQVVSLGHGRTPAKAWVDAACNIKRMK